METEGVEGDPHKSLTSQHTFKHKLVLELMDVKNVEEGSLNVMG